jgi:hypothetical protein
VTHGWNLRRRRFPFTAPARQLQERCDGPQ